MRPIKSVAVAVLFFGFAGAILLYVNREPSTNKNNVAIHTDKVFALHAADNAMLEVQLAQLVVQTTETPEVRALAETILLDQLTVNTELQNVVSGLNITMTGVMSDSTRKKYNALSEIANTNYEHQYIQLVVNDYENGINTYKRQLENGNDPELKEWAASKIELLQDHLRQARRIERDLRAI